MLIMTFLQQMFSQDKRVENNPPVSMLRIAMVDVKHMLSEAVWWTVFPPLGDATGKIFFEGLNNVHGGPGFFSLDLQLRLLSKPPVITVVEEGEQYGEKHGAPNQGYADLSAIC